MNKKENKYIGKSAYGFGECQECGEPFTQTGTNCDCTKDAPRVKWIRMERSGKDTPDTSPFKTEIIIELSFAESLSLLFTEEDGVSKVIQELKDVVDKLEELQEFYCQGGDDNEC